MDQYNKNEVLNERFQFLLYRLKLLCDSDKNV